ncbi:hypothetical protein HY214_02435 [Candidatus Roizmanbacteria bacterium]|nr:hypothetical protein [Candidatus Roizmanbacteria bacterium]
MLTRLVLEKIGFTKKNLPALNKIVISPKMTHYKDNPHTKDEAFINWAKDEFAPPLSPMELATYINHPAKFRRDLLNNLRLYLKFCQAVAKTLPRLELLSDSDKMVSLIVLLFLFQSAMDSHYYKYDYPLDLEEYPRSPLGWHYLRAENIVRVLAAGLHITDRRSWISEKVLILLSKNGLTLIKNLKPYLKQDQINNLQASFHALQIYQQVQQEENKLFTGKNMDSVVFTTGFKIWNMLSSLVKNTQESLFKDKKELLSILNGNPIYGTRKILVDLNKYFSNKLVEETKKNIRLWT